MKLYATRHALDRFKERFFVAIPAEALLSSVQVGTRLIDQGDAGRTVAAVWGVHRFVAKLAPGSKGKNSVAVVTVMRPEDFNLDGGEPNKAVRRKQRARRGWWRN